MRSSSIRARHVARNDSGQVTPFITVLLLALILVAALVLDAGLALCEKTRALDIAEAAARAGAQEINLSVFRTSGVAELDPASAESAARDWLAETGAEGDASATTRAVTVTVRRASQTQLLNLVGIDELSVSATASAQAIQGVTG